MMPFTKSLCIVAALLFGTLASLARAEEVQILHIPKSANRLPTSANYYFEEVLKLALEKTRPRYGKAELDYYPFISGRERQRAILRANAGLDIIWSSSNHQREEQLLLVKFNLLREISDYKILLIRAEDQPKFSTVRQLSDLRNFRAGTGSHWQDTQILQKNNMPLVTSWDYEPMFKMLAAKRFDYMVRGAQEIWGELEQHPAFGFAAEETLLIHYRLPVYFFVNAENIQLAERIKTGLEMAEKDGSLDKLFFSVPGFQQAYDEAHNQHRLVLEMENPD